MVGWLNILMDGWTDAVLTLGFFLDILHVRKVAKKILSFSKYSTSSHSCVRRDGRTDEWTNRKHGRSDGRTHVRTDDRQIDR